MVNEGVSRIVVNAIARAEGKDPSSYSVSEIMSRMEALKANSAKIKESNEEIEFNTKYEIAVKALNIPARYKDASISDFPSNPMIDRLVKGKDGLIMSMNGNGKTHLTWALAKEWIKANSKTKIVNIKGVRLLSDIKSVSGDWYEYIEDKYGMVDHLVIDEIDKVNGTETDWSLLTYLIDFRYEWLRQTIVIGNFKTPADIMSIIGQSSYSRITESGNAIIKMDGLGDHRRKETGTSPVSFLHDNPV